MRERFDQKTKPRGSLGRLESLAAEIAAVQQTDNPRARHKRVVVFAGDHGVAAEGVSLYPQIVTRQMLANFNTGGAAINVLCRLTQSELRVIDVGVCGEPGSEGVQSRVRCGTRNFLETAALETAEVTQAFAAGIAEAQGASVDGVDIFACGDMGIGNTTAASALLALLTDADPADTVGRGTGVDDHGLRRKVEVVQRAVSMHRRENMSVEEALSAVGGLEIAAIAGAFVGAASHSLPVIVDGFICSVAALAAVQLAPECRGAMFFAHRSAEQGHDLVLAELDAIPLLDLGLRLGEGTGAALAFSLIDASLSLLNEMATFNSAAISECSTRRGTR